MNTLKYGLAAILGAYLISTQGGNPAMAATLTGTIKVNISLGSDSNGNNFDGIYTGDFSYDDRHLTKIGSEFMNINGADGSLPGLLLLNFRFLDFATGLTPVTYKEIDHFNFPDGPILGFDNGLPTEFFFVVDPDKNGGVFGPNNGIGFLNPSIFRFGLQNGTIGGQGLVTLELDKPTPVDTTPVDPNPI